MISIRRPWCAALFLSALVVGCTTEEPATPTPAPAPVPSATEGKPEAKNLPTKPEIKAESPISEMRKEEAPKVEAPKIDPPKADAPKTDAPKADASKLSTEELAEIKKLPAAEQDAAIKQVSCPISDEHLGAMGIPVKVSAEGKTFYLCCKSCKKDVDADPKAAIAKLAGK
jgi:YHS domain-containing protein